MINIDDIPEPPKKELLRIKSQLTKMQESFCKFYVSNEFDAIRAAREAGYKNDDSAYELMATPKVCGRIQELIYPALAAAGITKERLISELKTQSNADISEVIEVNSDGKVSVKEDFGGRGKQIRRFTFKEGGIISIEMSDNLKAKELLMKALGIESPKEVNVNVGPNVEAINQWEIAKQRADRGLIDSVVIDVIDVEELPNEEDFEQN